MSGPLRVSATLAVLFEVFVLLCVRLGVLCGSAMNRRPQPSHRVSPSIIDVTRRQRLRVKIPALYFQHVHGHPPASQLTLTQTNIYFQNSKSLITCGLRHFHVTAPSSVQQPPCIMESEGVRAAGDLPGEHRANRYDRSDPKRTTPTFSTKLLAQTATIVAVVLR
jgi:hypothetical protein